MHDKEVWRQGRKERKKRKEKSKVFHDLGPGFFLGKEKMQMTAHYRSENSQKPKKSRNKEETEEKEKHSICTLISERCPLQALL